MTVSFDWAEFEQTLFEGVVGSVVSAAEDHPGERWYAAVLDHLYREEDGPIRLPFLGVNSVEALDREPAEGRARVRWSAPDWDVYLDDWLPGDSTGRWVEALTAEACSGTIAHWETTFDRYLTTLVRVCRRARAALRANSSTHEDFVVLLLDDEHHEALVKRVLTADEVRRHFPELEERSVALAGLAALPPAERAASLVPLLGAFDGPIDSDTAEAALRDLGPTAFPALIPLLDAPNRAWQAAKLLADIGRPDDRVVRALGEALSRTGGPNREWVGVALSRLGRLDLVLDQVESLPADVVVGAVAAPYSSFRDDAVIAPPLDYRPLADFIERWPALVPALDERLRPGHGDCEITADEVDAAVVGVGSPHVIVRRHAVSVLGRRRLGPHVGRKVLPLLGQVIRQDPDASVRRLAILSSLWWQKDSRHLADVVREASADDAEEVREAAAYWLREQGADEPGADEPA
ncbi:DUF4303 domain-containing protein [Saccharothrix sp. NRRL B-16314]|uniref:DUF4303 domain-containing protein n=1 Tax=Saccharothrix sp. NRRL B-16314 TaxID=1463825 RepID=UPI00068D6526|nr:DUF4303 domain-containing protein [Saccharothrix sp. NRRL B-16314]